VTQTKTGPNENIVEIPASGPFLANRDNSGRLVIGNGSGETNGTKAAMAVRTRITLGLNGMAKNGKLTPVKSAEIKKNVENILYCRNGESLNDAATLRAKFNAANEALKDANVDIDVYSLVTHPISWNL
jgi:hypothetical protein